MTEYEKMVKGLIYNPCRVLREVSEYDQKYFFENKELDWNTII